MEAKKNEGERWRIDSHSGVSWFARILHRMVICVRLKREDLVGRCSDRRKTQIRYVHFRQVFDFNVIL